MEPNCFLSVAPFLFLCTSEFVLFSLPRNLAAETFVMPGWVRTIGPPSRNPIGRVLCDRRYWRAGLCFKLRVQHFEITYLDQNRKEIGSRLISSHQYRMCTSRMACLVDICTSVFKHPFVANPCYSTLFCLLERESTDFIRADRGTGLGLEARNGPWLGCL